MNIIIVAGGLGTRFGTLSVFPKVLLASYKEDSILKEQYNYFNNKENNIYLIINEKFHKMVENYISVNEITGITLIKSTKINGSYNTIKEIKNQLPEEHCLFIWSDLVLEDFDIVKEIKKIGIDNNIVFTGENIYRLGFKNGNIYADPKEHGNLPGIYYFGKLPNFDIQNDINNYDLADYIQDLIETKHIEFLEGKVKNLNEYKDYYTYIRKISKYKPNTNQTRFFNKLIKNDDHTLTKKGILENYYEIIDKEINWYKRYYELHNESTIVPKIYKYGNHEFNLEYLDGYETLYSYLLKEHDINTIKEIYNILDKKLQNELYNVYEEVDYVTFYNDLKREAIDKVLERCDKIKYMLINYQPNKLIKLLNRAFNILLDCETGDKVKYYFCHGDLHASNMMIDPKTKDIKILDPRGYFGHTKLYGWYGYEYSKLLYSLEGFDDFNLNKKVYPYGIPNKFDFVYELDFLNKIEYKIFVGVTWIALAGYMSQDIMKSNIAYEYGIDYLTNCIREYETFNSN